MWEKHLMLDGNFRFIKMVFGVISNKREAMLAPKSVYVFSQNIFHPKQTLLKHP